MRVTPAVPLDGNALLIAAHLSNLTLAGYRPRTIKERQSCLRAFAATLDGLTITAANRLHVEAFLGRPLAAESRRAYRSHLRGFYAWCAAEGYVGADPTEKVPPIRVRQGLPRPVQQTDLAHAIEAAAPRMRAWLLLMSLAGLRCMEVAGLRPADVIVTGERTLLYLRETKGGGSATVPAHPAILLALADLPIRNTSWWEVAPATVSRTVGAYLASVGVDATAHQLRHYAGTAWYQASGHDLLTTARLLRHANVATSQVYAQLDPARPAEVVDLVALPSLAS